MSPKFSEIKIKVTAAQLIMKALPINKEYIEFNLGEIDI